MFTDERLLEIWYENGFDYNKTLGYCMETCKTEINKHSSVTNDLKSKLTTVVESRVPYTFYGQEKINLSYEELKELVKENNGMYLSENTGYHSVMYLNYDEAKLAFKDHLRELKSYVFTARKSKVVSALYDYKINLRINHIVLFEENECKCDICGIKVRYVSIDKDNREDIHKVTLWAIDQTNVPVRMTVDHKLARGLGGKNWVKNMVSMCEVCNQKKSVIESKIANHNRHVEKLNHAEVYPFQCSFYQ
jgi:5-methylcytosine-specific restriction endonuclease McrA